MGAGDPKAGAYVYTEGILTHQVISPVRAVVLSKIPLADHPGEPSSFLHPPIASLYWGSDF